MSILFAGIVIAHPPFPRKQSLEKITAETKINPLASIHLGLGNGKFERMTPGAIILRRGMFMMAENTVKGLPLVG